VQETDLRIGKEMIFAASRVKNPSLLLLPDIRDGQQHESKPEKEHSD